MLARARRCRELCAGFGVPLAAAAVQFPSLHPTVTGRPLTGSCVPHPQHGSQERPASHVLFSVALLRMNSFIGHELT
ncbi:hypothetical protein ACIREM_24130 [Streptomyces shenzhenensis]|uniref:hypothetical protein n=1 Tax=Streptomyces shenzhenensis TaxID=943815 RepID=UPI0037FE7730